MTNFISELSRDKLQFWRLDRAQHAPTWDSGEGAFRAGGRWNNAGTRCAYCSLDSSTAILEVAVHIGFPALNSQVHMLTRARIKDPSKLFICHPSNIPNLSWLIPGATSRGQKAFGDDLLSKYKFIALPGVVSPAGWNLIFTPSSLPGDYVMEMQVPLALDPRLDPITTL